jgi:hypothetical protein
MNSGNKIEPMKSQSRDNIIFPNKGYTYTIGQ